LRGITRRREDSRGWFLLMLQNKENIVIINRKKKKEKNHRKTPKPYKPTTTFSPSHTKPNQKSLLSALNCAQTHHTTPTAVRFEAGQ